MTTSPALKYGSKGFEDHCNTQETKWTIESPTRFPKPDTISRSELIERLKYSSKYNTPCPQWVYGVIENV